LDIIRDDIISFFDGKTKEEINLICPKVVDKEKQEIVDKLVQMRKLNNKTKELLTETLSLEDFIICEHCKSKMYKVPINVKYIKCGNKYVVIDENLHSTIRYSYMCENCIMAVSVESHNEIQDNLKLRNRLIEQGESYVPNKFGFWHWINHNKKTKPTEFFDDEKIECRRRDFEFCKIPGQRSEFVKITEYYPESNKTINLA
jgi:hypothetical protein